MDAFWFDSGDDRLFGTLYEPAADEAVDAAVVICSPLGYQGVCSYRPLRALAVELASSGLPTLRFDWPASGDSTGGARDHALVARWIAAVGAAADEARRRTDARRVAVLGVKSGATLAATAAARGADIAELVLWAPATSGKAYLREMRAFQRLAARTYPQPASSPPALPDGDEEASGFLLSAETVRDLLAIDLTELRWEPSGLERVRVGGTEVVAPEQSFVEALSSHSFEVDVATLPGVDGMLEDPNTSKVPADAFASIRSWLSGGERNGRPSPADGRGRSLTSDSWQEVVVQLDGRGTTLVCTVTRSTVPDASNTWVVLPSAGPVWRMGPNRLWTRFARAWAARGVSSLRLDIRGVGDSGGPDGTSEFVERFYSPESVDDVVVAIEYLRDHFGADRVAVVGLCSGAYAAFHVAAAREDLAAAVLVNPQLLFWDTDERALAQWTHIAKWSQWRRLVTGQLTVGGILSAPRRGWHALVASRRRGKQEVSHGEAVRGAIERIRRNGTALTFVYSLRDLGLTYLERQVGDATQGVVRELGGSLHIVEGADHTFRPLWTQDRLQEIVEGALEDAGVLPSDARSSGRRSDEVATEGKLVP